MTTHNVLVRVRDDAHARIAWAVASIPRLAPVGMLGNRPPASWKTLVRSSAASGPGDIVVDPDPDDAGIVVTAGPADRAGITHASPEGLARSLRVRLGEPDADVVWTTPGSTPRRGRAFRFPLPVGVVRGGPGPVPVSGSFAAAGAFGRNGSVVCVDERPFLEAICMAAGAVLATPVMTGPSPVWVDADRYVEACEALGLVLAEGISP